MDTTIWEGMQKQQLDGGLLLTSCGAELQELMRQIDIMVRHKKMEWEGELAAVQDKLEVREQELGHTKSMLNQKHQEVGMLKHKLDGFDGSQRNVVKQYESQLSYLRNELLQLKSTYSKMQKHYAKQGKISEREHTLQKELEKTRAELDSKVQQETEFVKEKGAFEVKLRALQHQIECLEAQRKSFAEKSERIQQQVYTYQARLKRSNQMIEEVESTSQNLVKKLESELINDKELIQTQENLIKELQNKTRELDDLRKGTVKEKYMLQEELDKATCRARVFEDEGRELTSTLKARESVMRDSEIEIAELKNRVSDLENMLRTKQKLIESLQTRSPLKSREDEMQRNVAHLESLVSTYRNSESSLREENRNLQKEVENSRQEIHNLTDALKNTEEAKVTNLNVEIRRLRNKVEEMEASHSTKLCSMKAEVTTIASHLHNRDVNIAQLGQTCGDMEKQLREECQRRDQLATELQMTAAQLENLRDQQTVTSQIVREKKATDQSLVEAEIDLTSLKENYTKAVGKLEEENIMLQKKVSSLKDQMLVKEQMGQDEYSSALSHTRDVINGIRGQEDDRIKKICDDYEKKIESLNSRLQEMSSKTSGKNHSVVTDGVLSDPADDNIPSLQIKISATSNGTSQPSTVVPPSVSSSKSSNSEAVKDFLEEVGSLRSRTPTPTRQFLKSIGIAPSTVTETSPNNSIFSTHMDDSIDERELNAILGLQQEDIGNNNKMSKNDGLQDFLKDEELRSKELESRIDKHIENMKEAMAATVNKYLAPV
ncbi:centrosomal protein of 63 kDa-like [Styela clava]